jgi:hypothetical protein
MSRFAPDAIDFGSAHEERVDGISAVYRVSQNTLCIELYANKIVDGKVPSSLSCATPGTGHRGSLRSK